MENGLIGSLAFFFRAEGTGHSWRLLRPVESLAMCPDNKDPSAIEMMLSSSSKSASGSATFLDDVDGFAVWVFATGFLLVEPAFFFLVAGALGLLEAASFLSLDADRFIGLFLASLDLVLRSGGPVGAEALRLVEEPLLGCDQHGAL